MTQAERVLKAARSFAGTCQADWLADPTPDGGPYITRVAARIQDLEDAGHSFELIGTRRKTRVYRLAGVEPGVVSAAPVPPGGVSHAGDGTGLSTRLFEVGRPEMGAYEYDLHGEAA